MNAEQITLTSDYLLSSVMRRTSRTVTMPCGAPSWKAPKTKGVHLLGGALELPALTEKDKKDLIFGCEQKIHLLAALFVRKALEFVELRKFLATHDGEGIKIISLIENR